LRSVASYKGVCMSIYDRDYMKERMNEKF
jgi:hypothetical protein